MAGVTEYITTQPWREVILLWYVLIDDAYQTLAQTYGSPRARGPAPTMSDSEVITVALVIDTYFAGHETHGLAFLRQYHQAEFPTLLERSRFNRRRRALGHLIEQIRQLITIPLLEMDPIRVVDSAPLPVCTYTRSPDCRTVQGWEYCGYSASKRQKYFGFKVHVSVTPDQVVDTWVLAPASHHDSTVAPALLEDRRNLLVLGDKAYVRPLLSGWMKEVCHAQLWAPPRRRDREQWPTAFARCTNRIRRRVETALSTLCRVFGLERLGSRSLEGVVCRVATRMLGYAISCWSTYLLNKGRPTST